MDQETKQQFEKMDQRFERMDQRFEKMDKKFEDLLLTVKDGFDSVSERFDSVSERFDSVSERFDSVEQDVKILKTTVVTKEYLDEKLADLGAEIGRRIDNSNKMQKAFHVKLIEFLKKDKVLQPDHITELEEMLA